MHAPPEPLEEGFEALAAPSGLTRRVQILVLAVALVVATIIGFHWLTSSAPPIRITVYGQAVADPAKVLDTAQRQFRNYAAKRHGTLGDDAKCWFQRLADATDIDGSLLCGPVLFYDDDPRTPYLSFDLTAHGTNPVHLDPATRPTSPEPIPAAVGTTLIRPDGTSPPLPSAGFAAPIPPPAPANTLAITDTVHPAELVSAPGIAVMGSDTITVRLAAYGPVVDFGSGAAERSAPEGQELYAFRLVFGGGENGFELVSHLDLGVAVGRSAPRPLHLPVKGVDETGQLFVVAIPPAAAMNLVLTQRGVTQRLSLRDGRPGPDNITYLQGTQRLAVKSVQQAVRATVTVGGESHATRFYAVLISGIRQFFLPGTGEHPTRTDHVLLLLDFGYWLPSVRGEHFFSTADITLTPKGGSPIRAQTLAEGPIVFDVPEGMTDGTITVRGIDKHPGYTVSISTPLTLPLHLFPSTT